MDLSEQADIERMYSFIPVSGLDPGIVDRMDMLKQRFKSLHYDIMALAPTNRARTLALTDLQQSKMWAIQAIVDGESLPGA